MYPRKIAVSLFGTLVLALTACGPEEETTEDPCATNGICVCETDDDCGEGEVCSTFRICEAAPDADTGGTDMGTTDTPDVGDQDTVTFDVPEDADFVPGACSGTRDTNTLSDEEIWPGCGLNCRTAADPNECAVSCLETSGVSSECSECHGSYIVCMVDVCPCLADPELTASCEECLETALTECDPDLVACAGNREVDSGPIELGCTEDERDMLDPVEAFEVSRACVEGCDFDDDVCVSTCLETLPVGVPCGLCFVNQVGCADEQCVVECVEDGESCDSCRRSACIEPLEECTGVELQVVDDAPLSRVRVVHMTADATSLSGYLIGEEEPFAPEVEFGTASDASTRIAITGDTVELRQSSEGVGGAVLYDATFPQDPEGTEVWTLATYGPLADGTSWFFSHDMSDRPGSARWQFFNGSVLLGEIDVYDIGGAEPVTVATDISYGDSTDRETTEVGSYALGFDSDDDGEVDYEFGVGPFEFGSEVSLFLFDDGVAAVYLMAVFVDGQTIRYNPSN